MNKLQQIINELDELYILKNVTSIHDDVRNQFSRRKLKVESDAEFDNLIADYYNFHHISCISFGGNLTKSEAAGAAKEIISNVYAKKGMSILNAYHDGKTGLNGGMYKILDSIADSLKAKALDRHIRNVVDKYIPRTNWEEKVAIISAILKEIPGNPTYIDKNHPERYANNYEEFIMGLVNHINHQATLFRNY